MNRTLKMESIRWAFNFQKWNPGKEEWKNCISAIMQEEKERIGKFIFKKDAKASLVGRLMIRKLVSEVYDIPWSEVRLIRTEKGRPFHENEKDSTHLSFNISHQGHWVILAAETSGSIVGSDIMNIESASKKNVPEFFRLMRRQFTEEEWQIIHSARCEQEQLKLFYRNWCLKEAFVKSLGVGISYDLQSLSFLTLHDINKETLVTDTKVKVDGVIDPNWRFHELLLDDEHIVTTAIHGLSNLSSPLIKYKILSYDDLASHMQQITPIDNNAVASFICKAETPWPNQ